MKAQLVILLAVLVHAAGAVTPSGKLRVEFSSAGLFVVSFKEVR